MASWIGLEVYCVETRQYRPADKYGLPPLPAVALCMESENSRVKVVGDIALKANNKEYLLLYLKFL
jgi:hypothetical protein